MSDHLKETSTEELEAELKRRREEQQRILDEKFKRKAARNLEHIDVLLELTPDHSMSSCNDHRLINAERGCFRCHLVESKRDNYWDHRSLLVMRIARI